MPDEKSSLPLLLNPLCSVVLVVYDAKQTATDDDDAIAPSHGVLLLLLPETSLADVILFF
jgi:hypothetical protein